MSEVNNDARILPVKPGAALVVVSLVAGILSIVTARECHLNLEAHGLYASFLPSLLYGSVIWGWWVPFTALLWHFATRWPIVLKPSVRMISGNLGLACALAATHLFFLQRTVYFASAHWPTWGRHYASHGVQDPEHFGLEIVLYGFIYGMCAFLHSRMQTQHALIQKLKVEMQLEPHFLFNTLNAITSLVAQGRNPEAMKTLAHLNTILRTTLQRRAPEKVPFVEELRVIESYLAIQKVRFADRLQIKVEATPEALEGLIPCFLLQPIVENAIQHGIAPRADGGMVETCVKRVGDTLWMQVRDNGCGPNGSRSKGHGIGIQNTRERLAYFYPDAHEFHAVTPAEGGYEVTIQIPYESAAL
jgi:hypothetical protein